MREQLRKMSKSYWIKTIFEKRLTMFERFGIRVESWYFRKIRFWARVDSWYFWKITFLDSGGPHGFLVFMENPFFNLKDFQESPNPLKIPIPIPASNQGGPLEALLMVLCSLEASRG